MKVTFSVNLIQPDDADGTKTRRIEREVELPEEPQWDDTIACAPGCWTSVEYVGRHWITLDPPELVREVELVEFDERFDAAAAAVITSQLLCHGWAEVELDDA